MKIDYERFGVPIFNYDSIDDLCNSENADGGLFLVKSPLGLIDFQFEPALRSETLCVFFNSAIEITESTVLPTYQGFGLLADLGINKIFISDPAVLNSELRSGFFLGGVNLDFVSWVGKIIRYILGNIIKSGVKKVNLIFAGSSAGGFAALSVALSFPGSCVIANSPQTNLYVHSSRDLLNEISESLFGCSEFNLIENNRNQINLCLKAHEFISKNIFIHWVQNLSDWHLRLHLLPFLDALASYVHIKELPKGEVLRVQFGDWGAGHVWPPYDSFKKLIHDCVGDYDGFRKA